MPLVRLTPSRWLWLSSTAPAFLPALASHSSWHSHASGWLALRSVRLPGLWLLLVRHLPTTRKIARLGLPV